jgi:hypothetical protein
MFSQPRPRNRRLTIIAQDPSVRAGARKILTTEVEVPAEELAPGPRGYRVHVVDYDTSTGTLYMPREYDPLKDGQYPDPYKERAARADNLELLDDPQFHAQNVYAIVMRTLARFEFALGRRVGWGFPGHQLHVAPHAFADANAFYSERDQALMFGYFAGQTGRGGRMVFSCLSHDIVVHETTHAIVDGLREHYTDPSSPEQAGFHEGFADVVALLSVFSLSDVVEHLLKRNHPGGRARGDLIDPRALTVEALRSSVLMGLAEQMGSELNGVRGDRAGALRRSVELRPLKPSDDPDKYAKQEEFQEPHRRGEILVAAMMGAFLDVWLQRIKRMQRGRLRGSRLDLQSVVEEGASAANQLLTMAIRALDYAPPTDLQFCDYLSALLTADRELVPDDTKYRYRGILLRNFADYGLRPPPRETDADGAWKMVDINDLTYERTHFESMNRDPDEVFRFIWENREALRVHKDAYTRVQSVRPCLRIGPDGFTLRETVAEYVQTLTLRASELQTLETPVGIPDGMRLEREVTLYGGGALVFDEYGRLKYHARNPILSPRQTPRLKYLWEYGYFTRDAYTENAFARLHLQRATNRSRNATEEF